MKLDLMENHHFFASSAATWITSTAERNLEALLAHMNKEGYAYNLFLVPLPQTAVYDIDWFQPQVAGTMWLGAFAPKAKRKTKAA